MFLDRSTPPPFFAINQHAIPPVEHHILTNKINLFALKIGREPITRLELVFDAGTKHETEEGTSFFLIKSLSEGTLQHTGKQISEFFEQFGAFIEFNHNADNASIVLSCLSKYVVTLLPLLQEMITNPVFPAKELETTKNSVLQGLQVNLQKNAFLAGQLIKKELFGSHPYGFSLGAEHIEAVNQESVETAFKALIKNQNYSIFVTGDIPDAIIENINNTFGQSHIQTNIERSPIKMSNGAISVPNIVSKPDSLQSSIRMGRLAINRTNPDFTQFLVMNEVFGGYFGSRLMKNIREDKGFTYGISSNLVPLIECGYWILGTDVKKENTVQTLEEIEKEIKLIQTNVVETEELEKAKSYMIGQFVGSLNTCFNLMDRHKVIKLNNLPDNFYDDHVSRIRAVTPEQVQNMANKYLNNLQTVVVG